MLSGVISYGFLVRLISLETKVELKCDDYILYHYFQVTFPNILVMTIRVQQGLCVFHS